MSKAPVTVLPKPCLKQTFGAAFCSQKKHAHFPPPSQEARHYSGIEYDRTPIMVSANELALPARGCPGRTFDEVDVHHYRHHSKKHFKSDTSKPTNSRGDEVHPNYFISTAAPMNMPLELSQSQLLVDAGAMSSLSMIHGDTSESDGDLSPPTSESDGRPCSTSSVSMARGHSPRRLLKGSITAERRRASGNALFERTSNLLPPSSTSTAFASCPGSNSCLGGF